MPAYGLFAAWGDSDGVTRLLRKPDAAPVCSDGGPVSVTAGTSVSLPLSCTGWRPERQVTTPPSKGSLGTIDQDAGTVTYTAGDVAGSDSVGYRAGNGAGDGPTATVSVTVTAKPAVVPAGQGSPAPGPGPSSAAADRTAPLISAVAVSPASVRRRKLRTPTLRFTLSEAASVTVTLERLVPGRRVKGRCVTKPAPKPRAPGVRCTSAVRVSRKTTAAPAGPAKLRISLKRGARALPAGSYRLTIAARDQAGNVAKAAVVKLRIR